MNCDDVFNVLTRGPFPSGEASDSAVEAHLAACHDCRQLAEALRPAVALFEEAMGVEEARVLPGYWGELPAGGRGRAAAIATSPSPAIAAPAQHQGSWRCERASWCIAVVLLLGVCVTGTAIGFALAGKLPQQQYTIAAACLKPAANDVAASNIHRTPHLHALGGTGVSPVSLSAVEIKTRLQCCTDCHAVDRRQSLAKPAMAHLLLTCNLCHPD